MTDPSDYHWQVAPRFFSFPQCCVRIPSHSFDYASETNFVRDMNPGPPGHAQKLDYLTDAPNLSATLPREDVSYCGLHNKNITKIPKSYL